MVLIVGLPVDVLSFLSFRIQESLAAVLLFLLSSLINSILFLPIPPPTLFHNDNIVIWFLLLY